MIWLSSLPVWGPSSWAWLALALLVAVVARLATRALVPAAEHDQVQPIASPRMPALGAAFAFFTALTLSSEAAYLRSAEVLASDEAAAASRLAWAATSPGVQSEPIHSALRDYLQTTRAREWRGAGAATGDDPVTGRAIDPIDAIVHDLGGP